MYLAAQWASTGTEVLLVEADPAGGSLSHHLGIQFTPGLASFVASGLEVRGGNLIDHSQDVLFNNLHVMPATSSPAGARQIVKWLDDRAGEFRTVADTELAVIVDGGRVTADSAATALATNAAGVVVVARGDSSPTSLEHLGGLLSAEACGAGVERCAVTVGDSPLSAEEWQERCDIKFCGAIKEFDEVRGDLAAFLSRNRRKSKKWRVSLEAVAEALLPYAKPSASGRPRTRRADEAVEEHDAYRESAAWQGVGGVPSASAHGEAPQSEFDPYVGSAGREYGEGPPPPPYSHSVPTAGYPRAPHAQHHPSEQQPAYFESPPAPLEPAYHDAPQPVYDPPQPPFPNQPQGYPQPAAPQPSPHGYPPQPAPQQPPAGYQQPPHEFLQSVAPPAHPSPYPQVPEPQHPSHQSPHSAGQAVQPESPTEHEVAPSGSFRDWAARLHGQAPEGTSTHGHGGVS